MREILFKAKRVDNGEWVEGHYTECRGETFIGIDTSSMFEIFCPPVIRWFKVSSETLCQFTGLCDKNGNKIWENDILRGHGNNKDLSKVAFGDFEVIDAETLEAVDNVIGWHYEPIPTDALSKCEPFCLPMPLTNYYIDRCEFEVVGNIYDNLELLEEEHGE